MIDKPKFIEKKFSLVFFFVTSLFMLWGIAITMGDVLNRHFQNVLDLSKSQSGLIQFSIFGAYAVMAVPAGMFMKKYGYKKGVVLGLLLYALGALLFIPAANTQSFGFFRIALFILAGGLATLETVAHPFAAALGDQRTSDQRLNFAQSFNGLGAVIGPLIGGYFLLRVGAGSHHGEDLFSVKAVYASIGIVIIIIAIVFSFIKVPNLKVTSQKTYDIEKLENKSVLKRIFKRSHFRWAIAAQFFNVAAQGGTWAFFINYGHEKMGFTDEKASYFFALSMFMLMVGRFLSTFIMRYIAPNKLLALYAFLNIIACLIITQSLGWYSFIALMMLNFFMGIFYPTIFSLGLKDLKEDTQTASSFIVMGVVGGALFPPLMGVIANVNIATAYYLPILCYIVIFLFAYKFYKVNESEG